MKSIRNSIKAIIIKDGKLLTIKNLDSEGDWYVLPGGGQDHGETMYETLKRECLEEINCQIKIKDIVLVREYLGINHEFAEVDKDVHQIEYMFECELGAGEEPSMGCHPDHMQIGIEWLDIDRINNYRLYPLSIREDFVSKIRNRIYFGAVN